MPFNVLSWAMGLALTSGIKGFYKKRFESLEAKLDGAVNMWAKELPSDVQLQPEALFIDIKDSTEPIDFPSLISLRTILEHSEVPDENSWFEALLERWNYIGKTHRGDAQQFFLQSPDVAEGQLHLLANRLQMECKKDETIFRVTTLNLLKDIQMSMINLEAKSTINTSIRKEFDNNLIHQISIAGHITDKHGAKRAIYFDKDDIYVHRGVQEKLVFTEIRNFLEEPATNNKWISIIGDAGHGKSSLIWYLYDVLKEHPNFPIYCILAQLSGKEAFNTLDIQLPEIKNNAILFIDTLDILAGIDDPRLILMLNNVRNAGHLLITTSRRQEMKKLGAQSDIEIDLGRYTDVEAKEAIWKYINVCYPEMQNHEADAQFEKVWNLLDSQKQIQELDLEPLILSMIFQSYAPDEIPQDINTQKVYSHFWHKQILDDRTVKSPEDKFKRTSLCGLLAFSISFLNEGSSDTYPIEKLRVEWERRYKSKLPYSIIEQLISSGVIHWARGHTHIRFFHQTFLEYVAAIALRSLDPREYDVFINQLYDDLKNNIFMRIPILKQLAIQDFYEGGVGWKEIMQKLSELGSLYSLQLALEISGKLTDNEFPLELCRQWIRKDPSHYATTVCERVQYYPKSKMKLAIEFLEPCLDSHEEIAIYNLCGKKLAMLDAMSVQKFLHERAPFIKSSSSNDDQKAYFKEAIIDVFRFGAIDAIDDLFDLFPYMRDGQKAGLISGISNLIKLENAQYVANFCDRIIDLVIDAEKGEVRRSYINLMTKLDGVSQEYTAAICSNILSQNKAKKNEISAIFVGRLTGRFLLNKDLAQLCLSNLNSTDPLLRLFNTWALLEAKPLLHNLILNDILKINFRSLGENSLQLLFRVASTLTSAGFDETMKFIEECPWPKNVVSPDEFKRIFYNLADQNVMLTKSWLLKNMIDAKDIRLHQIVSALIGLIERDVTSLTSEEMSALYRISHGSEGMLLSFIDIVGLTIYIDKDLAHRIFDELLESRNRNVRTRAILSLKRCVNDHLDFVLEQGNKVFEISGSKDNFALLHCLLLVLKEYHGPLSHQLLTQIDAWFSKKSLSTVQVEKTLTEVLMILKIRAKDDPFLIFDISERIPVISKGVAGALSALYANIVFYVEKNPDILLNILPNFMRLAKFKQRRIRNALRTTLPVLAGKVGSVRLFDVFFNTYKEIEDAQALEDLIKAIIGVADWGKEETEILLSDEKLPAQIRSLLYSRIYS